jgi:hypothetical protein
VESGAAVGDCGDLLPQDLSSFRSRTTSSNTPEVVKGSGSKLLDEAAQSWARAAKWVPATLNGCRVEGCTQIDVAFEATA